MEILRCLLLICVAFLQMNVAIGDGSQTESTTASASGSPSKGFQCTKQGIFQDPEDCHSFYRCTEDLKAKHDACWPFTYFNPRTGGCSFGGCSIFTKPGIITGSTTNKDFKCDVPGTQADPKDCSGFYICSEDLKPSHYQCFWGLGHYDVETQGCSLGFC
ncbi:uncharacterized protein [Periplaneta americana]|uniref:uncharacterized protein n=1 Tax=Periplaneta americana TaxID=6978 RepID=UPI0037E857BD